MTNNINCKKAAINYTKLCLFDGAWPTAVPQDQPQNMVLWTGSTNQITPYIYTLNKAHGQLWHV